MMGDNNFEMWLTRGMIAVLGALVIKLIYDRWRRQDSLETSYKLSLDDQRKPLVTATLDPALLDFSGCGRIPHNIPELTAETGL